MPECYAHTYTAAQALIRSAQTVASHPAFLAGANGPDPLFMYRLWSKRREPDLPKLALVMHKEKTGAFLNALVEYAITPVQQSYALGFLTHYTTDCTLNPYIAAMSAKGKPYAGAEGRRRMAASLDSSLYHKDYKTYLVPLHAGTPVLITEDLAQVTTLLHDAILQVYGIDVPPVALADTFHDNLSARRALLSRTGIKKTFLRLVEPLMREKPGGGVVSSRMQPAPPLKRLPEKWTNPYTGEEMDLTLDEVVALAEQTGAAAITAAMRFWLGELDEHQLAAILGNNNYYTGLPVKPAVPDDGAARPEELADATDA